MATALVTLHFIKPDDEGHSKMFELEKITFIELMPRVVDIADDILHNDLPPGSKVSSIQITWTATP